VQLTTKAGLVLVALGVGIFSAWHWWTKTRNFVPVDIPVSLAANQSITAQFKPNFDGLYLVEIDAGRTLPPDTLHCLMGLEADPARCKGLPAAIAANWILSSEGQELKRGSSVELHSVPVESQIVTRVIGDFQGKAGRDYTLQVTFLADGASLAVAHPRLKVAVASIAYTDLESASVLVFSMAFICGLFGVILLGIALSAKHSTRVV